VQPKSVLVYNASWHTFGGGEKYICTLADELSKVGTYRVELLVDKPSITKESLGRYFNLGLERVVVRTTTSRRVPSLLSSADIGVVVSNFRSFGNPARRNVYILQIPYAKITPSRIIGRVVHGEVKEAGKDIFRRSLLSTARNTDMVLVYSEFVKEVLYRSHNIDAQVLYPAIDDFARADRKENMILSVGRVFRGLYNDKRYDFLIEAFKGLRERLPHTSWIYRIAGSCGSDTASQRYLEELRSAASGHPVYFHINSTYEELRRYYNHADIFWHAAGYGVDENRHPERTEHFGMSTVESMSAGCVPVVVNRGGQKEIVSHGKSGYLWNTRDELLEYTASLLNDPERRNTMRQLARQRFQDFDHRHFAGTLISLFGQLDQD
jgi:glycosyltransferase involved in cell wall biosynthesis